MLLTLGGSPGCCTSGSPEYGGMLVGNTYVLHCLVVSDLSNQFTEGRTYYFQAKSLSKQRAGRTSPISQKTGLGNNLGMTPRNSSEIPVIGATYA